MYVSTYLYIMYITLVYLLTVGNIRSRNLIETPRRQGKGLIQTVIMKVT